MGKYIKIWDPPTDGEKTPDSIKNSYVHINLPVDINYGDDPANITVNLSLLQNINGAVFSKDKKHRYYLFRIWDTAKPRALFIGLNPSKADGETDDPTIKRVKQIAHFNGFGGITMLNLFTFITPNPGDLIVDRNWEENKARIYRYFLSHQETVCAWGNFTEAKERALELLNSIKSAKALHINKNGSPKHPLYCKKNSPLIDYIVPRET